LLRYIKFEDLKVCTYYGLKDPFSTGILSGLLGIVKMYAVPVQITQYPDFFTTNEYLRIDASGYIKLGNTIKNVISNHRLQKGA
jgi:hypothetical protein